MTREEYNTEQRARRADLRARGICVDCGKGKAHVDEKGKRHVCCDVCLAARRKRAKEGKKPPLIKLIEKVTAQT
jgi:hypothetical protein